MVRDTEGADRTFIHREVRALVLLTLVAVLAFLVTRAVAKANTERRAQDAQVWFERGEQAMKDGRAADAARALRRATVTDPANIRYRLQLASALSAANADPEARQVLLSVRTMTPDSADVNLALGRLEARQGNVSSTVGYYQAALNTMWRQQEAPTRHRVRLELIEFLLGRGQRSRALSEILMLAADLPETAAAHAQAGRLFLDAGDPTHALVQLDLASEIDPADQNVRFLAAKAAFSLGDYTRARRYLRGTSDIPEARELRSTITLVLASDPLAPRLTVAERRRRFAAAIARARERLDMCAASPGAQGSTGFASLDPRLQTFESLLGPHPPKDAPPVMDTIDDGMDLVLQIEESSGSCGPVNPLDSALILIGQRHRTGAA
jgi:tetratricopeptide (TPR) repeat protein